MQGENANRCSQSKENLCSYTSKKWVPLLLPLKSDSYLGTIHIWRPWELSNFQDPPPSLSSYVQYSSIPLTLDVQFQTNPLSLSLSLQMIINQLKESIIQGWLWYVIRSFLQVDFFFIINSLIFSGFPLTSFHSVEANLVPTAI